MLQILTAKILLTSVSHSNIRRKRKKPFFSHLNSNCVAFIYTPIIETQWVVLHHLRIVCCFLQTSFSHIFLKWSIDEKASNNYQAAPPPGMGQPAYVGAPVFIPSEFPMQCVCPHCRQQIITRTTKENGLLTWLCIGGLCLIGCWFGCCLIPLCVDACKVTYYRYFNRLLIDWNFSLIGYCSLLSKLFDSFGREESLMINWTIFQTIFDISS